jgi:hypothetical protein
VGAAQATATTLALTAGGAATVHVGRRVGLALRAGAMLELLMASHFDEQEGPSRLSRWLPGGVAAVEAAVWLSPAVAWVASGGVEVTAGRTDVFVDGVKLATIPEARATGELGLRIRF